MTDRQTAERYDANCFFSINNARDHKTAGVASSSQQLSIRQQCMHELHVITPPSHSYRHVYNEYLAWLFSNKQYGFIKDQQFFFKILHDDWTSQLDAGKQIDVIYTDFEKAFDEVLHHHALISKLLAYGLDDTLIQWLRLPV